MRKAITGGWALPVDAGCLQVLQKPGYVPAFKQAQKAAGVRVQDPFLDETAASSEHFPLVVDLVPLARVRERSRTNNST